MYNPNKPSQLVALLANADEVTTMSSLEIATVAEKDHKNVLADIRKMLNDLGIEGAEFSAPFKMPSGQNTTVYNLPYRESMILMAGYSIKIRARIVDEWIELKERARLSAVAHWRSLGLPASQDEMELAMQNRSLKDRMAEVREVRLLEITQVQLDLLGKLRTVEAAQATALAAAATQEAAEYKRLAANAGFWLEASISEDDIV